MWNQHNSLYFVCLYTKNGVIAFFKFGSWTVLMKNSTNVSPQIGSIILTEYTASLFKTIHDFMNDKERRQFFYLSEQLISLNCDQISDGKYKSIMVVIRPISFSLKAWPHWLSKNISRIAINSRKTSKQNESLFSFHYFDRLRHCSHLSEYILWILLYWSNDFWSNWSQLIGWE